MTSTGNRTQVAHMVVQWFTHYATAAITHIVINYSLHLYDYLVNKISEILTISFIFKVRKKLEGIGWFIVDDASLHEAESQKTSLI